MSEYAWSVPPGGLVERPGIVPGAPEIWVYADRFSYFGGDTVSIRVHTTAEEYDLEIVRDGARPQQVAQYVGLPGKQQQTPADAYAVGCDWSESLAVEIDPKWTSGMYLVLVRMLHEGVTIEREASSSSRRANPSMPTSYSFTPPARCWPTTTGGGANHYRGVRDGSGDVPTPISSTQRPVARGGCCANPRRSTQHPHRHTGNRMDTPSPAVRMGVGERLLASPCGRLLGHLREAVHGLGGRAGVPRPPRDTTRSA